MYLGAGKTGYRFVLIFGDIGIIVRFVLDIEAGRRASWKLATDIWNDGK
jgi:hypothetical protein